MNCFGYRRFGVASITKRRRRLALLNLTAAIMSNSTSSTQHIITTIKAKFRLGCAVNNGENKGEVRGFVGGGAELE